jgi:hypothetical protein
MVFAQSDVDAVRRFVRECLPVSRSTFMKPLCVPCLHRIDRTRPRFTKTEVRGGFLRDEFVGGFNDRAKWITQLTGVFSVGVVNAPELPARLQCRTRFHGDSSPEIKCAKMYQVHIIHGES